MTDVNHQVIKALVKEAGENSLIALEELAGIRSETKRFASVITGTLWVGRSTNFVR
jgi:hypothetical protein